MNKKIEKYNNASDPIPEKQVLWPLYGAGFENLGKDGHMIEVPVPTPGPGELLVRHDAVGLCFSDIKVITLGQTHPRIYKDMRSDPVVLGHEVAMTVVKVGEDLKETIPTGRPFYHPGGYFYQGCGLCLWI